MHGVKMNRNVHEQIVENPNVQ